MKTVYLVDPKTDEADVWLRNHTDGVWMGTALAVEHRYIEDLVGGLEEAGFQRGEDFEVL